MSGMGFTPAPGGGSAVTTVAGRTGDVVLAVGDISGAAPTAGPTFTGIVTLPSGLVLPAGVTAPDQSAGDNSGKVANTKYADAIAALKANIASPTFTGTTTAPEFSASGLTGATAASRYAGATANGAPATGTFAVGDFVVDQGGTMWVCIGAGTPGTWRPLSATLPDFLSANPNLIPYVGGSAQAGQAALTPMFYEIDAQGFPMMTLASIQMKISTLLAANTFGAAVYSISYSSNQTFAASLICQLNAAGSTAATGVILADVTTGAAGSGAAAASLLFATTKYVIGTMMSDVATSKYMGLGGSTTNPGLGLFRWSAAARSSTTDWPASFTQTSVSAPNGSTNPPWLGLVSSNGKFRF